MFQTSSQSCRRQPPRTLSSPKRYAIYSQDAQPNIANKRQRKKIGKGPKGWQQQQKLYCLPVLTANLKQLPTVVEEKIIPYQELTYSIVQSIAFSFRSNFKENMISMQQAAQLQENLIKNINFTIKENPEQGKNNIKTNLHENPKESEQIQNNQNDKIKKKQINKKRWILSQENTKITAEQLIEPDDNLLLVHKNLYSNDFLLSVNHQKYHQENQQTQNNQLLKIEDDDYDCLPDFFRKSCSERDGSLLNQSREFQEPNSIIQAKFPDQFQRDRLEVDEYFLRE